MGKSIITMDIKPWEAETDMAILEHSIRKITKDGLTWGTSQLMDIGYGIKKLRMIIVVVDEQVSADALEEEITELGDGEYVQSTEIIAFQKV